MQSAELNKIKARIKAMTTKTIDAGCSEAEAMAAMEMVGKLLSQYNLSMDEIDVRQSICKTIYIDTHSKRGGAIDSCLIALANLFYAKVWRTHRWVENEGSRLHYAFFGQEQDLEVIEYLYSVIDNAIKSETQSFKQTEDYKNSRFRKSATVSFGYGMSARISSRLTQMRKDNEAELRRAHEAQVQAEAEGVVEAGPAPAANAKRGTALIALKGQLIEDEFKKDGPGRLRKNYSTRRASDSRSYYKGQEAGGKVNLTRPIGGGSKAAGYLS